MSKKNRYVLLAVSGKRAGRYVNLTNACEYTRDEKKATVFDYAGAKSMQNKKTEIIVKM